jgi:HEPN domain-containing protein
MQIIGRGYPTKISWPGTSTWPSASRSKKGARSLAAPPAALPKVREESGRVAYDRFLEYARIGIEKDWPKQAAFHLHQATEGLYYCLLLVVTLYAPKSHNLVRLRGMAEPLDPRLAEVWPTDTKFHKRCFELLRAAYVKARYSPHYKITAEELAWIQARVEVLQSLVKELCEARLRELRVTADEQ